ncbi:hypothetical protein X740_30795 [Mesorhizobium sp. LNHC221B00]|nr:hypothetical protein X740_30795 [Mesorhizobium sp. LNHC221B00]
MIFLRKLLGLKKPSAAIIARSRCMVLAFKRLK